MPRFYSFASHILQGASFSGKSTTMIRIIRERKEAFFLEPSKIIYVYNHYQKIYDELISNAPDLDILFTRNIPSEEELVELTKPHAHTILVLDDQMTRIAANDFMVDVFTRLCHHLKMSCFLLLQSSNLSNTKYGGEIIRNSHYYFLFKSPQIGHCIRSLGVRINDYRNLIQAYKLATSGRNYSYLLICVHPRASSIERYSTNVLPSDPYCKLFIAKSS